MYSTRMDSPAVRLLAQHHGLPPETVAAVAAQVAQRCALIANRYGAAGDGLGADAPVGAAIGAAILEAFTASSAGRAEPGGPSG